MASPTSENSLAVRCGRLWAGRSGPATSRPPLLSARRGVIIFLLLVRGTTSFSGACLLLLLLGRHAVSSKEVLAPSEASSGGVIMAARKRALRTRSTSGAGGGEKMDDLLSERLDQVCGERHPLQHHSPQPLRPTPTVAHARAPPTRRPVSLRPASLRSARAITVTRTSPPPSRTRFVVVVCSIFSSLKGIERCVRGDAAAAQQVQARDGGGQAVERRRDGGAWRAQAF